MSDTPTITEFLDKMPKSFRDIQERCDATRLRLHVAQRNELEDAVGEGLHPPTYIDRFFDFVHVIGAEIISKDEILETNYFIIGRSRDYYYNTSKLMAIDLEHKLFETQSGSLYEYKELRLGDPDNLIEGLCATFTHFGWSEFTNTPAMSFSRYG